MKRNKLLLITFVTFGLLFAFNSNRLFAQQYFLHDLGNIKINWNANWYNDTRGFSQPEGMYYPNGFYHRNMVDRAYINYYSLPYLIIN